MKRIIETKQLKATALALIVGTSSSFAGVVSGKIVDKETNEPLIGVSVMVQGTTSGTVTDVDGNYELKIPDGTYDLVIKYVGYEDFIMPDYQVKGNVDNLNVEMTTSSSTLSEVTVTARARMDTDVNQVMQQKLSLVVQSGVSEQQIQRTQDKDASEVIRRVPGISIIEDKFVMVRGLSQRYNNVWLNGAAVPSSEADSRAFSFDILPSSQLDNITIVKSPAPEYPSDFTGGFVLIHTKQQPVSQRFNISVGGGFNTNTHFRNFIVPQGKHTWINNPLTYYPGSEKIDVLGNGLDNNWKIKTICPWVDAKINASYSQTWHFDGSQLGLLAAANYSNSYKSLTDMENSLYGPYDTSKDKEVFLRKATDNQYSFDSKLGALLNLSYQTADARNIFDWKNIFNRLTKDRYSERVGFNAQPDNIHDYEYYYTSRNTFNTQFSGMHELNADHKLNWNVGYAYADRNMPDRRLIETNDRTDQRMSIYRIGREFSKLQEHIASGGVNYTGNFHFGEFSPMLKAGVYGEYRTRDYNTRQFQYGWDPDNNLPNGWMFNPNITDEILIDENYGPDKLYLYEEVNFLNNYKASGRQMSGYVGLNLPWRNFSLYAGVRYENVRQTLRMNTRQYEQSLRATNYDYNDLFPSVNLTYRINDAHQLRAAYGRSVNRPEFRELSPSVFYDFDLSSNVMGNYDLKAAYIDNVDLRYEWYPSAGEQVSVALFYKHFKDPIEWTYTVAGGTDLIYSFINALGANNYGVEVDIRKNLGFMGLKDFSFSFNGALIKSKVQFAPGTNDIDRPMQGQSPYLINTGLFYNSQNGWSAAILYNRIGERIIGVGNRYGVAADGTAKNIPNSYEMPRDNIDLSVGKKFGGWDIKLSVRDLLAQSYLFQQFEKININGENRTVSEVTRKYKPGMNISISVGYTFQKNNN